MGLNRARHGKFRFCVSGICLTAAVLAGCGGGGGGSNEGQAAPTPGVFVAVNSGSIYVVEGGDGGNYSVALNTPPADDVFITLAGSSQIEIHPSQLRFTPLDWNVAKPVTVKAVDDSLAEGPDPEYIQHSVKSGDVDYNGIAVVPLQVNVIDDDESVAVRFAGGGVAVAEAKGPVEVSLQLAIDKAVSLSGPINVSLVAAGVTTAAADSYAIGEPSVTFPAGSVSGDTVSVVVDFQDDTDIESISRLQLIPRIVSPVPVQIDSNASYSVEFHDDDSYDLLAAGLTDYGAFQLAQFFSVDKTTGKSVSRSAMGPLGYRNIADVAYDVEHGRGYAVAKGQLIAINLESGEAESIGATIDATGLTYATGRGVLYGSNGFQLFALDPATGAATLRGVFGGGYSHVDSLAYDESADLIFGVDLYANKLLVIHPADGSAQSVGGLAPAAGVAGLALDQKSGTLYGVSVSQDRLYVIDTETGATTARSASPSAFGFGNVAGIAFDPARRMLTGVDTVSNRLVKINPENGVGSGGPLVSFGNAFGIGLDALTFDEKNLALLGISRDGLGRQHLVRVDGSIGRSRSLGLITGANGPINGLAYDKAADSLYAINATSLLRIDTATGKATVLGPTHVNARGLAYDSERKMLYAVDDANDELVTLDPKTGAAEALGLLGFTQVRGLAIAEDSGELFGIDSGGIGGEVKLIAIDRVSGQGRLVHPIIADSPSGAIAFDGGRKSLVFATNLGLLDLSPGQGAARSIGSSAAGRVAGMAADPQSHAVFACAELSARSVLLTVDVSSGATTSLAWLPADRAIEALAYDTGRKRLYGADAISGSLVSMDPKTAAVSSFVTIVGQGYSVLGDAIAFDSTADVLYAIGGKTAAGSSSGAIDYFLLRIPRVDGAVEEVGLLAQEVTDMVFDTAQSAILAVDTRDHLLRIDVATGVATEIGPLERRQITALALLPRP